MPHCEGSLPSVQEARPQKERLSPHLMWIVFRRQQRPAWTLVLVATREVNARAGGDERGGRSCWQRERMLALATRVVECLCWQRTLALATRAVDSRASGVLATDARAGDKSGGCLCSRRRARWTLVLVATREVDGGRSCWWRRARWMLVLVVTREVDGRPCHGCRRRR